jgi:predicted nuclease of predicted toxin-antitoxin system
MTALRLLIDQMIDVDVAAAVERLGHDVRTVGSYGFARADDADIIRLACDEGRILVTLDEHFGDWAVLPLEHHPGVIRVKADPTTTSEISAVLLPFLEQYADRDFTDHLVIVRRRRIRWIKTGGASLEQPS